MAVDKIILRVCRVRQVSLYRNFSASRHRPARNKQSNFYRLEVRELARLSSAHQSSPTSSEDSAREKSSDLLILYKYISFTLTNKHLFFVPHQVSQVDSQPWCQRNFIFNLSTRTSDWDLPLYINVKVSVNLAMKPKVHILPEYSISFDHCFKFNFVQFITYYYAHFK